MVQALNVEEILTAARNGDKEAESELFAKLFVRFLPIVSRDIRMHSVLHDKFDIDTKCREICEQAISEVKRLYPVHSEKFLLKRAVLVLHNVVDDFITDTLYYLAKEGNKEAESFLFSLLRKKLFVYLRSKVWGS